MAPQPPDLVGWPLEEAVRRLEAEGWQVEALEETRPPRAQAGERARGRVARVRAVGDGVVALVYVVPPPPV
jgi:hypothetical protein